MNELPVFGLCFTTIAFYLRYHPISLKTNYMGTTVNWKSLIFNINNQALVPVIGNDLSYISLKAEKYNASEHADLLLRSGEQKDNRLFINLYRYLPVRLWEIFGKGPLPNKTDLNHITLQLYEEGILENEILTAIRQEIHSLEDDEIWWQPYAQLASIQGFDTIISVNYDHFLERAFELAGRHINASRHFTIPPAAQNPDVRTDPALPIVYNLMGSIEGLNFAVTDEQSLEFLYLQLNSSDLQTRELFNRINRKNLLLIGSSFPDWFMRFFIRILSNERFRNSIKAKMVACNSASYEPELRTFLESNAIRVVPIGNPEQQGEFPSASAFVDEMFKQNSNNKARIEKEKKFRENVFISYSRDDKEWATRIRNELEKNGVNVFFDEDDLKTGDHYNQLIRKYLKECDYFLAVISEHAVGDPNRYVYDKEWRYAIFLEDDRHFIRPFIIDQTSPQDSRIPEEIRNLSISSIPDPNELENIIRKFIRENSFTPITDSNG